MRTNEYSNERSRSSVYSQRRTGEWRTNPERLVTSKSRPSWAREINLTNVTEQWASGPFSLCFLSKDRDQSFHITPRVWACVGAWFPPVLCRLFTWFLQPADPELLCDSLSIRSRVPVRLPAPNHGCVWVYLAVDSDGAISIMKQIIHWHVCR